MRDLNEGKRVEAVEDVLSVGQKIEVEIAEVDDRGKFSLVLASHEEDDDTEE